MIGILKLGIRGMSFEEKVANVLDNLDVYVRDATLSYRERIYYHNRIFQEVFTQEELNVIHQIDCYRGDKNDKRFVSCVVVDKSRRGKGHIYLYYDSIGKYEEITMEELAAEVRDGLTMGQGVQGLRKYLRNKDNIDNLRKHKRETVRNLLDELQAKGNVNDIR